MHIYTVSVLKVQPVPRGGFSQGIFRTTNHAANERRHIPKCLGHIWHLLLGLISTIPEGMHNLKVTKLMS